MNEEQWLTCSDPAKMLMFLRGKINERKLRLFACACCRQGWRWLNAHPLRLAVEAAEQYADNHITEEDLAEARAAAWAVRDTRAPHAAAAARATVRESAWPAAREAQQEIIHQVWKKVERAWGTASDEKKACQRRQCDLLRDLVGNPFRRVTVDPAWRGWRGGLLMSMADRIYQARDFSDLPVLADALEEAGCTEPEMPRHCREPRPHVRGCWVIDLVLGRPHRDLASC
jgi:hypothetical protein